MTGHAELVRIGDVEFFVEVAEAGGPQPVGAARVLSFDAVRDTVEVIASQLAHDWETVRPAEARVEFGLNATAGTGKPTGLLVEGGASAALKVTLTWKSGTSTSEQSPGAGEPGTDGGDDSG